MRFLLACLTIPALALAGCSQSASPDKAPATATNHMSDSDMAMMSDSDSKDPVKSAMSAAPSSVAKDATVMGFDDKGGMTTLRKGSNGWTCMPDTPMTPGSDPMCVDEGGMAWVTAWATHKDPPKGTLGFGYMLRGGSDADNDDPFATKPPAGKDWVTTGPHVMVFNYGQNFAGYPTNADNTKVPYVMFPNTPYAHLMVPVK